MSEALLQSPDSLVPDFTTPNVTENAVGESVAVISGLTQAHGTQIFQASPSAAPSAQPSLQLQDHQASNLLQEGHVVGTPRSVARRGSWAAEPVDSTGSGINAQVNKTTLMKGMLGFQFKGLLVVRYCELTCDSLISWNSEEDRTEEPKGVMELSVLSDVVFTSSGMQLAYQGHEVGVHIGTKEKLQDWTHALHSLLAPEQLRNPPSAQSGRGGGRDTRLNNAVPVLGAATVRGSCSRERDASAGTGTRGRSLSPTFAVAASPRRGIAITQPTLIPRCAFTTPSRRQSPPPGLRVDPDLVAQRHGGKPFRTSTYARVHTTAMNDPPTPRSPTTHAPIVAKVTQGVSEVPGLTPPTSAGLLRLGSKAPGASKITGDGRLPAAQTRPTGPLAGKITGDDRTCSPTKARAALSRLQPCSWSKITG